MESFLPYLATSTVRSRIFVLENWTLTIRSRFRARLALQFRVTTASSPSAIDALPSSQSRIISTSQSPFKRSARGRQSPADSLSANKATRRRNVEACQSQNRPRRKGLTSERKRKMTWNDGENGPAFEKWMGFEIRGII